MSRDGKLTYCQIDCNIDWHPDHRRAGFAGSQVFMLLIRVSGDYGLRGIIQGKYLDPEFLLERFGRGCTLDFVTAGIADAFRAGLMRKDVAGAVIPDIERWYGADARRKKSLRDKAAPTYVPDKPANCTREEKSRSDLEPPNPLAKGDVVPGKESSATRRKRPTAAEKYSGIRTDNRPAPAPSDYSAEICPNCDKPLGGKPGDTFPLHKATFERMHVHCWHEVYGGSCERTEA